jgi:hypothetical protein
MSQTINVNGVSINYPETGDTNWSDEATNFAVQTSSALGKIGLSSGTSVDVAGTLDVTGATTLDSTLTVAGTTTLNGTVNLNGNNNLGNATSDTTAVTGILNVDSGVLYVDPTNNRIGVNKTNPAQALDVVGNSAISGNETIGGTLGITGDVAVNTNKFNITATSGNTTIAGTLGVTSDVAINTNKFNITASSGNTTIAGTLGVTGNTTLTGNLLNANGTAVAPSITFTSDTDNGLYYIGSNNFGIAAGGSKVSDISNLGTLNGTLGTDLRNVLQIVQGQADMTYSTNWIQTSNTNYWLVLQGIITPKSSSSKILIYGNSACYVPSTTTGNQNYYTCYKTTSFGTVRSDLGASAPATIIDKFLGGLSGSGAYGSFNNTPILSIISGLTAGTQYYISLISQTTSANPLSFNRDNTRSQLIFQEIL